jgi:exopolysaccharide production protein ExoZ
LAMPSQFRTTIPTFESLIKSLLFIPSLDPKAPLLLLGWSLNFEVFFYVLFVSLFFLKSEIRTLALLGLLAVLIGIGQFATHLDYVQTFYTSPSLVGFAFGTILAQAHRHGWLDRFTPSLRWKTIGALCALLVAFYMDDWSGSEEIALWKHVLMSATAVSIVLVALTHETAGVVTNMPALKYLGDTSYSIYLFHLFAVGAAWAVSKHFFDVHHWLPYLACTAFAITSGLATGVACHYLFEKPFLIGALKSRRAIQATVVQ